MITPRENYFNMKESYIYPLKARIKGYEHSIDKLVMNNLKL